MTKHAQLLIITAFIAQSAFAQSNDYQPGKSGIKFSDIKTYTSPTSSSSSPSTTSSTTTSSKTLSSDSTRNTTSQTKTGKGRYHTYKAAPPLKPAVSSSKSSSKDLGRADDASVATPVATTGTGSSNSSSSPSNSTTSSSSVSSSSKPAASNSPTETATAEAAPEEPRKKKHPGAKLNLGGFGAAIGAMGQLGSGLSGLRSGGGFTGTMSNLGTVGQAIGSAAKGLSTDTVIDPNAPPVSYKHAIPAEASGGIDNSITTTAVSGSVIPKKKHSKQAEEKAEPLPEDNRPIADKWAIVMGVGKFKDPTIPSLRYSVKDAKDFADFLVKEQHFAPDHVRLLLNEKATKDEFLDEIGDKFLPRVVHRDDLVVLFFSSHGSPAERDIGGSNFIVAYDTKKDSLYRTGIEMQELTRILRERTPRAKGDQEGARVCIVMDACHSGGGADGAKDAEDSNIDAKVVEVGRGQIVISSSSANERSWESKRYPNGVFTKNLMKNLKGDVGILDAVNACQKDVAEEVQQDDANTQTITVNAKSWNGKKLVLGSKPANPQPLPASVKALLPPDSKSAK